MSNSDELEEILSQFRSKNKADDKADDSNDSNVISNTPAVSDEPQQTSIVDDEDAEDDVAEDAIDDDIQDASSETTSEPELSKTVEESPIAVDDEQEEESSDSYLQSNDDTAQNINNFSDSYVDISSGEDITAEYPEDNDIMAEKSNKKGIIIAVVAVVLIIAIGVGVYFGFIKKDKGETELTTQEITTAEETTVAPVAVSNPLTGENDYNAQAVGKRPIACVVENSAAARPQWGIGSPDIIVEGEVEGGETRMLWLYADYTSVPEQIGPMRSARPPYIKFSELFDAIFIHWGQSKSKGSYVGAADVFKQDKVDHINQMTYSGKTKLYGRDKSRGGAVEHTGVLYGSKIAAAIDELGFRTEANDAKYTKFSFNSEDTKMSDSACDALSLKFSSRSSTRDWTYSTEDNMYHCNDYKTDVKVKNLVVLFDKTEYVSKSNYKGSGKSETYCNYGLAGGKGAIASEGTYTDITWSVVDGKIEIKDASGNTISLNQGRSWIGYGSSNNGGTVTEK